MRNFTSKVDHSNHKGCLVTVLVTAASRSSFQSTQLTLRLLEILTEILDLTRLDHGIHSESVFYVEY